MPVDFQQLTPEDLKDPKLQKLNEVLRTLYDDVLGLEGFTGTISLQNDLDMGGHRITNVGVAQSTTDVLSQSAADPMYSTTSQQSAMEALGTKMLQTARRLNDPDQRERSSSFLNEVASTPPSTNGSTVTVVAAGANSNVTVTASNQTFADLSTFPYSQRVDTFVNPGVGSNFYHYYIRRSDSTIQFIGPFTINASVDRINANSDGRTFLGTAQVNAGGGGTGGGGGDGGGTGCTEVGTLLELPPGSESRVLLEPCDDWIDIELEDGTFFRSARNTLVSVFKPNHEVVAGDRVEKRNGDWSKAKRVRENKKKSWKQVARVKPHGTYLANGARLHNLKP